MLRFCVPVHCSGPAMAGTTTLVAQLKRVVESIETSALHITIEYVEREATDKSFAALFVYDITNQASFEQASNKVRDCGSQVKALVGTHRDYQAQRQVKYVDVQQLQQTVPDVIWLETGRDVSNVELLSQYIGTAVQYQVNNVLRRNDSRVLKVIREGADDLADGRPTLVLDHENEENSQLRYLALDQEYENYFFFDDPPIQDNFEEPALVQTRPLQAFNEFDIGDYNQLTQAFEAFLRVSNAHLPQQQVEYYLAYIRAADKQKQAISKLETELQQTYAQSEKQLTEKQQRLQSLYENGLKVMKSNRDILNEKDERIQQLQYQISMLKNSQEDRAPSTHSGSQQFERGTAPRQNDLVLSNIENITPIKADGSGVFLDQGQKGIYTYARASALQPDHSVSPLDSMRFKKLETQVRNAMRQKIIVPPVENVRLMTGKPSPELLVKQEIDLVNNRVVPTKAITLDDICSSVERQKARISDSPYPKKKNERLVVLNNTYYTVPFYVGQDPMLAARRFLEKRKLGLQHLNNVAQYLSKRYQHCEKEQQNSLLFEFNVRVNDKIYHARWYSNDSLQTVAKRIMALAGATERLVYDDLCAQINAEYIRRK